MAPLSFASRQIGDFQITALSDGSMTATLALLSGIDTEDAEVIQQNAGIAAPNDIHINCYLIRGRGRTILVDSGRGNAGGVLKENLQSFGVNPEDIDTLLVTHAHPDHIGGLLDADGLPMYQNADIYLHPREVTYWQDDEAFSQANERVQRNFALARRTLAAYQQRLNVLSENAVIEGILPVWLPGHTPGHTGFRIDSGNESLLIWGDVVHFPHVQSAYPAVSIAFDYDPVQAEATRKAILELAVREKLIIGGMHLGRAGFAHVLSAGQGYRIDYLDD